MSSFRKENKESQRTSLCRRIHVKFPDRIPIICEKSQKAGDDVPTLDKIKFLVPKESTVGEFIANVRGRMSLPPHQAIFMFVGGNVLPPVSSNMETLYINHKSSDGFMYFEYSGENTFG